MLTLDKKVTLHCTDTGKDATGTIVRIQGNRVDVISINLPCQEAGTCPGER